MESLELREIRLSWPLGAFWKPFMSGKQVYFKDQNAWCEILDGWGTDTLLVAVVVDDRRERAPEVPPEGS